MPPLCTAGYGIATGNLYYFFGAFYLFFINTVFISVATYLVVRVLKYPKKVFLDKAREKTVHRYVGIIVFFTLVPSLFLSYNLIRTSYFNDRVTRYINQELVFPNTQLLSKSVTLTRDTQEIKVVFIGQHVPQGLIDNARLRMKNYGLDGTSLIVEQGFGEKATDVNELKSLLLQDLYKNSEEVLRIQSFTIDSLKKSLDQYKSYGLLTSQLLPEMRVLFPAVQEASFSRSFIMKTDSLKQDTVMLVYLKSTKQISKTDQDKLREWLVARIKMKNIKLLIE